MYAVISTEKIQLPAGSGDEYSVRSQSQYFPEVNLPDVVARCLEIAYQRNTSAAIRHLKQQFEA